jgi:hypothetical protein
VIYEVFITTLGGGMEMGCLLLLLESSWSTVAAAAVAAAAKSRACDLDDSDIS